MTPNLVKPIKCRRCDGMGDVVSRVVYAGMPGGCFKCAGTGVVEGDKAAIAATKARSEAVKGIIRFAIDTLVAAGVPNHTAMAVSYGIDHLSINAPERYEAALASYQAGHPGLVRALWAYTAEAGYVRYGTRQLSADDALALIGA